MSESTSPSDDRVDAEIVDVALDVSPEPVDEAVEEPEPEPVEEPEPVVAPATALAVPTAGDASFGRVEDDGTVYVRTADGERRVGQVPDVSADEAMAFFTGRYDSLAAEVALLGQRVIAGSMSPDEARRSIATLKANIAEANAVGDLETLS
ncbi:MAG: hypothetical protein FWF36_05935, partial [Propionibacteriaceae bacterium]|nr:hypothetical protein [Propionibacteriaceae bacterium]